MSELNENDDIEAGDEIEAEDEIEAGDDTEEMELNDLGNDISKTGNLSDENSDIEEDQNEEDETNDLNEDVDQDDDDDDDNEEMDEDEYSNIEQENTSGLSKSNTQVPSKKKILNQENQNYSIYNHEEDDYFNNEFLYKFDNDLKQNFILENHNECLNKNYNEVKKLSIVTRNKDNIIIDSFHRTIPILTKYEKTKVLGLRIKQLNNNYKPYISIDEHIIDNNIIATKELEEKKLPFIIVRPLPNNNFEYWKLQDLDIL